MFGKSALDANTMKKMNKIMMVAAASVMLASCSTAQNADGTINDPFEGTNRGIFAFNKAVDHVVINPIVKGYRYVVPQPARTGVRNVLRNLRSPITLANDVLQGDVNGAGKDVLRFTVNTLIGVGGIFDVAGMEGYAYEQEDFGQTLGKWGVPHGPYLVLPILGPSSTRDYAGYLVDSFMDPLRWWLFNTDNEGWYYAKVGVEYLDLRESLMDTLNELERSSIDYYAAVRSIYYQRRDALVRDQRATAAGGGATIPDYEKGESDHP